MAKDFSQINGPAGAALRVYKRAVPYRYRIMLWSWRQRRAKEQIEDRIAADPAQMARYRRDLDATLADHPDRKGVILFAPSANWTTPLFQRPHQMAIALADLGYLVLYCVFIDSPDDVETYREIRPNVVLCRVPPQAFRGFDEAVTVSYTHNYPWVKRAQAKRIIYELIDKFEIWSDFPSQLMRSYHRQLLERATVVAGTATDLMAELTPSRPDAILCPNAVDYAHFAPAAVASAAPLAQAPDDMRAILARSKPVIGYYGALAEWFDYDLLARTARALPDYEFVLVGPEYDLKLSDTAIHGVENIHWLDAKPYAALPAYLRCFTVATIPFVVNDAINAVSPLKLFEYMAGGKPIVTSDLVECRKYPVVLTAATPDEWVTRLREAVALSHDSAYLERLDVTARENTWHARARRLTAALEARERLDLATQSSAAIAR
ncbi:MAG TPA: glycosyltransferase [Ktedonobacterales bacterium]|jgi:glycosyltransferase involved in cell wall biosynthesis|nr:glycosyltransferase [Ktedonobacterales bacterium]